jgi:hypothetical protein
MVTAMRTSKAMIIAAVAIIGVWSAVLTVRSIASSRKITAQSVAQTIDDAEFADWSDMDGPVPEGAARRREESIREIAGMINRLDFNEREANRRSRTNEDFFRKLSSRERSLFIDLTVTESMNRFMQSLDAMPPEQRRRFVEQGLREIEEGRTADEVRRAKELGDDVLERITREGMRAYFEKSSTETKLDLAPLMEAVHETMQGLRGNQFGPRLEDR